MTEHDP